MPRLIPLGATCSRCGAERPLMLWSPVVGLCRQCVRDEVEDSSFLRGARDACAAVEAAEAALDEARAHRDWAVLRAYHARHSIMEIARATEGHYSRQAIHTLIRTDREAHEAAKAAGQGEPA